MRRGRRPAARWRRSRGARPRRPPRSRRPALALVEQLAQPLQLGVVDLFGLQQVQHQLARRAVEEAREDVLDDVPLRLVTGDDRAIDEGAPDRLVPDVAFLLEDAHRREDRVVGERRITDRVDDIGHARLVAVPEDLHEAVLRLRERGRLLARHTRTLARRAGRVNYCFKKEAAPPREGTAPYARSAVGRSDLDRRIVLAGRDLFRGDDLGGRRAVRVGARLGRELAADARGDREVLVRSAALVLRDDDARVRLLDRLVVALAEVRRARLRRVVVVVLERFDQLLRVGGAGVLDAVDD